MKKHSLQRVYFLVNILFIQFREYKIKNNIIVLKKYICKKFVSKSKTFILEKNTQNYIIWENKNDK